MNKIRVVHVIWRLSTGGGIPVVSRQVLSGLDSRRFDAHAVTVRPWLAEDRLDELGPHVTVHPLGFRGEVSRLAEPRLAWAIARTVHALRPGVVHAHGGTARLAMLAAGRTRSAARVLELHAPLHYGYHSRLTDAIEVGLVRRGRFLPVVHSTAMRTSTARVLGWEERRIPLVPLGGAVRSPDSGSGRRLRGELGIPDGVAVVCYAGRAATKNVPLFVRVARDVLDRRPGSAAFLLVGNQSPQVHALVADLGLERDVHVVPPFAPLDPAFAASDVFLSTSDYESFGLAVAEAMAAGVTVVATAVGGVCDLVVDGETGRLCPRRDRAALAEAVTALLDDGLLRAAMGAAGRRRVESHFTTEHMLRGFERLYEGTVA